MNAIILLALPLIAAALSCLPWRRLAEGATIAACVAEFALSLLLVSKVTTQGSVTAFSQQIVVDGLSALILLLVAFVGLTAAFFSLGYLGRKSHETKQLRLYYANYNLFIFSMLLIPMLVEPTLVWIVVGLTTVCSALLVCFENTNEALEAAWKYFLLSLMGAAVALLGFLVLFAAMQAAGGGTYTWAGLIKAAPAMPPVLLRTAFVLVLVGLGAKAGLVPMHTWLPDAHSQAPSPVCALLSGVETTAVLYVILRLFPVMKAAPGTHAEMWAIVFGLVSVGTAAFLLLQVRNYKRMFAFSTVEHMGIILLAVGLGSQAANYGALYQALCHTVTKSFCFFAAGAALMAVDSCEIQAVRGLIRTSPFAGACLLLGGLSIAGAPPFAVFLSEFSIFKAGLSQGFYIPMALLALFVTIGFFGIMLHVNRMVFGENNSPVTTGARLPATCLSVLAVSGALVMVLGVYLPPPLHGLLQMGAQALQR